MDDELFQLPENPFFSCDEDGLSVVDADEMRDGMALRTIEPVLKLTVGERNAFERRPRRVAGREGDVVTIECDDDVTVLLDFHELTVRSLTPEGEFVYRGGLEEGNDGLGFVPAR